MKNQTDILCVSCRDSLIPVAEQEQVSIFECSKWLAQPYIKTINAQFAIQKLFMW